MKTVLLALLYLFTLSNHSFALDPIKELEDQRSENSPEMQAAVTATSVGTRLSAAIALGRIQRPTGVLQLLILSRDESALVRAAALFGLGQLGWEKRFSGEFYEQIVNRLVEVASNATLESSERIIAVEALGKMGTKQFEDILFPLLSSKNPPELNAEVLVAHYRSRMVQKMQDETFKPAPLTEAHFQALAEIAGGADFAKSNVLQKNLAFFLARTKEPRAASLIFSLLKNEDTWIRYYAIQAAGKMAIPESIPALLERLGDEDPWNRVAAIESLKATKASKDLFVKFTPQMAKKDSAFQVRLQYLAAIDDFDGLTQTDVKPFLKDPSSQVRAQVYTMILRHKWDNWQQSLEFALADPNWPVRLSAIETIAEFSPPLKRSLRQGYQDVNVQVRAAALTGLGKIAEPSVVSYLDNSLQSNQLVERSTAVDVLSQRNDPEKFALAKRTYLNSLDPKWNEMREGLISIFASDTSDDSNEILKQALKDPLPSVQSKATEILKQRGIAADFPHILSTPLTYSPYRELQFDKDPLLKWTTSKGSFVVQLYHDKAPIHVANIMGYARAGRYNNTVWHRVVPNFVVQGGDPDGTGWGDAGYSLRAEINSQKFERGSLGMPRSSSFDSGGVQVFFNHVPTPTLDGQYTVFGKIISGISVIDRLEVGDVIYKVEEVSTPFW